MSGFDLIVKVLTFCLAAWCWPFVFLLVWFYKKPSFAFVYCILLVSCEVPVPFSNNVNCFLMQMKSDLKKKKKGKKPQTNKPKRSTGFMQWDSILVFRWGSVTVGCPVCLWNGVLMMSCSLCAPLPVEITHVMLFLTLLPLWVCSKGHDNSILIGSSRFSFRPALFPLHFSRSGTRAGLFLI